MAIGNVGKRGDATTGGHGGDGHGTGGCCAANQKPRSTDAFIGCTRHHTFRDFLAAAVIGGRIATYEQFFDVGGLLWHNTTLLDFESLQPALQAFCDDNGLGHAR